jgi:hypothetical protein
MNVETWTVASQFPEKECINGIFDVVCIAKKYNLLMPIFIVITYGTLFFKCLRRWSTNHSGHLALYPGHSTGHSGINT